MDWNSKRFFMFQYRSLTGRRAHITAPLEVIDRRQEIATPANGFSVKGLDAHRMWLAEELARHLTI